MIDAADIQRLHESKEELDVSLLFTWSLNRDSFIFQNHFTLFSELVYLIAGNGSHLSYLSIIFTQEYFFLHLYMKMR